MTPTGTTQAPPPPDKFHQELKDLQEKLLELAQLAEAALAKSLTALWQRDQALARQVMAQDAAVNDLEEEIDITCVKLLALYQPVAVDLRLVMAVDHIIAELERLGDIAVNIAEEVLELLRLPDQDLHPFLTQMAFMAQTMVQRSLSAFVERNPRLAREVCQADREVDDLDRLIIQELLAAMEGHKDAIAFDHAQVNIVRNLERAADHATNIAEQVVFMVEGESVRHRCQG